MNIDRNNYEIYFLDYLEGRLTAEETAGLLLFVKENPDLKALIEDEEWISLDPDKAIDFYPKFALKRETNEVDESGLTDIGSLPGNAVISTSGINARNYEEFMVRYHENDLNDSEKSALADFLKDNPSLIREFELFENTLLKADTAISYPYKSGLKRNIIKRYRTKKVLAIISMAASVLLFSTLMLKYINQPIPKGVEIQLVQADNRSSKTKKVLTNTNIPTGSKSIDINRTFNSEQLTTTATRKTNPSVRTTFVVPESLSFREPTLMATTRIRVPRTIERRTDFDGITSTAYYDPDPDVLPLNTKGTTISGRLGYTLAQGISQTAGIIAREPEVARFLSGKFSLSAIADLGLAGFNLITDRKLSISRNYDSDGYPKGYSLNEGDRRLTRLP